MAVAMFFGALKLRPRPLTRKERQQRDVCLCDSCCAQMPERAKLRAERFGEVRRRFDASYYKGE